MEGICTLIIYTIFFSFIYPNRHGVDMCLQVPEESQLVFRASASSLECCCFINNDEFLSGSDDGSIEHWSVLRKKPLHIVKNAHPSLMIPNKPDDDDDDLPNGDKGKIKSWIVDILIKKKIMIYVLFFVR